MAKTYQSKFFGHSNPALWRSFGLFILISSSTSQLAWGQSGDSTEMLNDSKPDDSYMIEEITVVAERRETLLQETPVTVSAFTGEFLENAGIKDARDLAAHAPGLYLDGFAMLGSFPVSIRGVGSSVGGIGGDDPVSLYSDGVYVGRPSGLVFQFVDVERIEVLRGPQGTLYGRNATGGAVNVVTKSPSETITGSAGIDYSRGEFGSKHFDDIRTEFGLSGPITDKVAFRLAGVYRDMDGFQENLFDGNPVNGETDFAVRGSLQITPNDNLTIKFNADYADEDDPYAFKDVATGIGNPDVVDVNDQPYATRNPAGASATISYDFGSFSLESLTGYRKDKLDIRSDSDLSPLPQTIVSLTEEQDQFTQEFRLLSQSDGPLVWSAGVYYLYADGESSLSVDFPQDFFPTPSTLFVENEIEVKSSAVYGQATYSLTERLNVTGGLRYTDETKDFSIGRFGVGSLPPVLTPTTDLTEDWDAWTPKLGLDYQIKDNAMLYASVSRGFKSGGFNFTSDQAAFDPEYVLAYEVGLKSDWFQRRLIANIAAFYYDYEDLQVRIPASVSSISIQNAASAEISGWEAEFIAKPSVAFQIEGSIAYLDATYSEFRIPAGFDPITGEPITDGSGNIIFQDDLEGNRLNRSPEWQVSLAAQYVWPLANWGSATLRGSYQHQSEVFFTEQNDPIFGNDGWENYDVRMIFNNTDESWQITIYGENLSDERYIGNVVDVNPGAGGFVNRPRRFGLSLMRRF